MDKITIPNVRRDETCIDEIHGVKISDPYRWLEDPDSEETKAFVEAQNAITKPYLQKCSYRNFIKTKLTEMWNYKKYSVPFKRGKRYFYFMNTGLQNQSVLYVQDSLTESPRVFFDVNLLAEDGTLSIQGSSFSEDGETYAYGLSKSGSDWITIHFKKVSDGEDYPEVLEKVKFSSMAWTHDNQGIFYNPYPDQDGKNDGTETLSDQIQKLYYHKLGTPQSEDILITDRLKESKRMGAEVSDCGKYLIVTAVIDYVDNLVYYAPIPDTINDKIELIPVIDSYEAIYEYITNDGTVCIFRTNKDAPNYKLIKIDLANPNPDNRTTLIPEHEKDVLDWAACVHEDKLITCYISDVKNILQVRSLKTGELVYDIPLQLGTISGYSGRRNQSEIFFRFTSFTTPGIVYHLDLTNPEYVPKIFREIEVNGVDISNLEAKQVFYETTDGTKIPMFIIHKKGIENNGKNTTLLYGYGGFNISLQPYFSISRVFFMNMFNGIVAVANIRGGGEYGESWHNAGKKKNKQNCFTDFQEAAKYLIKENYTSADHLIIQGGSNGGLLVGACVNQAPELFKVAIAQCGVLDMVRFHKFTIAYAWCHDFGDPDDKDEFPFILKYSPLHNVQRPANGVQYPAMLLTTADHDDRVVPLHSFKMISELHHKICLDNPSQKNPILIRIETKAGHGAGKPTSKIIEEHTDMYSFIIEAMDLHDLDQNTNF